MLNNSGGPRQVDESKETTIYFINLFIIQIIVSAFIRLETKSCRILPLTYVTKYDLT